MSNPKTVKKFTSEVESLRGYECPGWFRDAKFGIYCHWGPQCVPRAGDWYARHMYVQGHRQYKVHLNQYGHPSEFGYKDVINLWKAENFDADDLIRQFKNAGAKFTGPVAIHHDNFALWDSKVKSRWNTTKVGPMRDIVGLWKEAAEKHGLIFGCTTHMSRTYSWFQTCHHADKVGPQKGVSYDGNDPEFSDLYLTPEKDHNRSAPLNPPIEWREHWKACMKELIDNYHPQFFYYDAAIPFAGEDGGESGREIMAHFYNDNLRQTGGVSNGFLTIKDIKNHGPFVADISSVDWERKHLTKPNPVPWQTDDSIGDWFYDKGDRYKSAADIICMLIEIVAMNGSLMLNVPVMPDGTLDAPSSVILLKMGYWLKKNGEAIYGTRPWTVAKEKKVFFTQKHDMVYILLPKKPFRRRLSLKSLGGSSCGRKIKSISSLSKGESLPFSQGASGLKIKFPKHTLDPVATAVKVEFIEL